MVKVSAIVSVNEASVGSYCLLLEMVLLEILQIKFDFEAFHCNKLRENLD